MTREFGSALYSRKGVRVLACVLVSVFTLAASAQGPGVVFGWTVGGEPRSVELNENLRDGVSYVSLNRLAEAVGAGFSTVNDRVQLDLVGQTAWIAAGGTEVYGSLNRATLSFPLVMDAETAYIAKNDVVPLFRTCFRIALTTNSHQQGNMPELVVPELDEDLEALGLKPSADTPAAPAANFRRIVIDPGHGGSDDGAIGVAGTTEKAITLAVAQLLKAELEKTEGVTVWLTRKDDAELSAAQRGNEAVVQNADCFISVHAGASYAPGGAGFTIYYPLASRNALGQTSSTPARSRASGILAEHIGNALSEATGDRSVGIRSMPLLAAPDSETPAVLVELGYLSTPEEENLLNNAEFQARTAAALAKGLQGAGGTTP